MTDTLDGPDGPVEVTLIDAGAPVVIVPVMLSDSPAMRHRRRWMAAPTYWPGSRTCADRAR